MKKKNRHKRISKRMWQIVQHAARYRLTTKEIVHRLHYAGKQPNAATKAVNRLCDDDWLRKFPLVYPGQYFVSGPRSVRALGLPRDRILPLGPQSLPTEFAVLLYAHSAKKLRRVSPSEVTTVCPWYLKEWTNATHILRMNESPHVLELIRVDLGGPADHVARKCANDVLVRIAAKECRDAIANGLFRVVVVTATTDKAAAIQLSLESREWPRGLRLHLSVVPELLPLLPRCQNAT